MYLLRQVRQYFLTLVYDISSDRPIFFTPCKYRIHIQYSKYTQLERKPYTQTLAVRSSSKKSRNSDLHIILSQERDY